MRDPNTTDAQLLLQLEALRYTPPMDEAFTWAWKQFERKGHAPEAGVAEQAEADRAVGAFSTFFESAGVLVRDGLLHEEVFFDRYMVKPFWKLAIESTERQRKKTGSAGIGENFEWLAAHEAEISAHIEARHRRDDAARRSAK